MASFDVESLFTNVLMGKAIWGVFPSNKKAHFKNLVIYLQKQLLFSLYFGYTH